MSNIQRLATEGEKNHKIFVATIVDLRHTKGFYGRLYNAVNEMDDESYAKFYKQLSQQNFKDPLDVIFWLEC